MVVAAEFVMDASFTLPWIFKDEVNPLSDEAWKRLIEKTSTAHVPGLWALEIVNVAIRGPRNSETKPSKADIDEFFAIVRRMPVRVHHQGLEVLLERAPLLMRRHKLTAYDSSYLMLALANGVPLATRDKNLRKAALAEGVEVIW